MPAPIKNKYAAGNKGGGRKTDYKPEFAKMAYKTALLGATDNDLAELFNVSEKTINTWKLKHKEFFTALKKGKLQADAEVAKRLYDRAMGYKFTEVTFERIDSKSILEKLVDSEIMQDVYKKKIVVKEVVPDTTAQIFWLKNRSKENWRDKQNFEMDFETLSEEQLDLIISKIMVKINANESK